MRRELDDWHLDLAQVTSSLELSGRPLEGVAARQRLRALPSPENVLRTEIAMLCAGQSPSLLQIRNVALSLAGEQLRLGRVPNLPTLALLAMEMFRLAGRQ
jgi:hypothetical protein